MSAAFNRGINLELNKKGPIFSEEPIFLVPEIKKFPKPDQKKSNNLKQRTSKVALMSKEKPLKS